MVWHDGKALNRGDGRTRFVKGADAFYHRSGDGRELAFSRGYDFRQGLAMREAFERHHIEKGS